MSAPAGWYDDGSDHVRYWDGRAWTSHVAPRDPAQPSRSSGSMPGQGASDLPRATEGFAEPDAGGAREPVQRVFSSTPPPLAPGAPLRKSRGGLWVALGLVGLLVVIGGAMAATVLAMRAATDAPADALAALAESWRSQDCAAEYDLVHPYVMDAMNVTEYCEDADYTWFAEMEGWRYEIVGSEIQDATAYVSTRESYTWDGEEITEEWVYEFRRVDGRWLYYDATM